EYPIDRAVGGEVLGRGKNSNRRTYVENSLQESTPDLRVFERGLRNQEQDEIRDPAHQGVSGSKPVDRGPEGQLQSCPCCRTRERRRERMPTQLPPNRVRGPQ